MDEIVNELEDKVIFIDVENRPGNPLYEQLGHNTAINESRTALKVVGDIVHALPVNNPTRIRNLAQKYVTSYFKLTTAQYFATTIRKHHRCVEMAIINNDMDKAMHHIDQCIKLAPNSAKFHIQRAEIYAKRQDYQHAITDLHHALSLSSQSSDLESMNQSITTTDSDSSSSMSTCLSHTEYINVLLKTGQLHIIYGRSLFTEEKFEEALKQFEIGKSFIDQYAQMKDLITDKSVTPGILITLMDVLKVYESMKRDNDCIDLITKCVNTLEKENSRVRDEIFKENSFQITRLNLPQLPDLLFAKAKILLKQSGQSITQAYYDLKKAVHYCPAHSKSFSLLNQLENLSSGKQEEAIMSMLKYRFLDALQSINVAIYAQPENTSLYFDKGAILRKLDRLSESVDSILQGMHRLDTLNISAQNNLSDQYQSLYQSGKNQLFLTMSCYAIKLFKDGNYQESNALTCQLLKVDPTNYRLLILFGDCQYQMHNYEDSLKEYENAKSIINKLFSNSNQCICNNTMMFPESLKSINQRICLTCYNLSKIRIKQNDCLSALTFLNRCIQLAPFNSEFYMTRALVHYQLSNAKQSWDDVLVFVYLNLSDWALCQNTNGKWPTYPVWYQSIVHNRFICQVNEQIGPLIHRLTPKYIDLVKVAQSKECEQCLINNLRDIIDKNKCELCNNTNYTKSISTNIASDIEQKFENTIDWLNKHVSFNLFSEAYETDDSSNVIDDQKKCKNIDHAAQLKSYSTIKEDYQKIKKEILNIRQKKYLR